jgi:hypothetical protein
MGLNANCKCFPESGVHQSFFRDSYVQKYAHVLDHAKIQSTEDSGISRGVEK